MFDDDTLYLAGGPALLELGRPSTLAHSRSEGRGPVFIELGSNGALRAAAAGALVGRLAQPASERATHRWLQARSGLGELLGVDFETVSAMQLYRASDALVKHREAVEAHLFDRALAARGRSLFAEPRCSGNLAMSD